MVFIYAYVIGVALLILLGITDIVNDFRGRDTHYARNYAEFMGGVAAVGVALLALMFFVGLFILCIMVIVG